MVTGEQTVSVSSANVLVGPFACEWFGFGTLLFELPVIPVTQGPFRLGDNRH